MTINGDSTRIVEARSNRGIEGSTAINSIPDGFCLELENANIGQAGVIRKRDGYNLWGCELPVKCRKYTTPGVAPAIAILQLDSTPVITLECTLYKNSKGKINELVPEYYNTITDDYLNTVICVFSNLPTGFTPTTSMLLELTNGVFVCPLFVANATTVLLPITVLPQMAAAGDVTAYYVGYPTCDTAWSLAVIAANRPLLHTGAALESFDESYFNTITGDGSYFYLEELKDTGLQAGDTVFFESNVNYLAGANPETATQNYGIVVQVVVTTVTTLKVYPYNPNVTPAPYKNYFRLRALRGRSINIITGPASDPANVFSQSQNLTFTDPITQLVVDTGAVTLSSILRPISVNTILANPYQYSDPTAPVQLAAAEKPMFLYGTRVSPGYVGLLNKYYNKDVGYEVLVAGVNGNLFEETANNVVLDTIPVPLITGLTQNVQPDLVTLYAKINITGASKVYQIGDTVFRTTLTGVSNTPVEESYVVVAVGAGDITVQALTSAVIVVVAGNRWKIRRTSSKIYLRHTNVTVFAGSGTEEIRDHGLCSGMTVQVGNRGNDYPHYTITYVNRSSETGVAPWEGYRSYIEINDSITWESDAKLYLEPTWTPIFTGTAGSYEYAPITSAQYDQNSRDLYSANFDYALYIAAGVNSIWRYDGKDLSNLRLPAPPFAYWRNLPNSSGFLPVKLGENGKAVGELVNIRLTYIYTDNYDRTYESPVCPDSDLTVITSPVDDGSDNARLLEIRVPSIPQNIGFPADKIRIRAYRQFTGADDVSLYRVDVEVANDYGNALTSLIVGDSAPSFSTQYEILYTEVEKLGSNMPAPMADIISVLDNKLVALGGYEPPQIQVVCNQVFAQENVDNSPFAAYARLDYRQLFVNPATNLQEVISFVPVPLSILANTAATPWYTQTSVTGYPASGHPNFKVFETQSYAANGLFTIDYNMTKGFYYTDSSSKFLIQAANVLNSLTCTEDFNAKLRILGTKFTTTPTIDFNREIFKANLVTSGGIDRIQLTSPVRWGSIDATSLLGTDTTRAAYFEQVATPDPLVGNNITNVGTGNTNQGAVIVIAGTANKGSVILQLQDATIAPAKFLAGDFLVLQMNAKIDGSFINDTLGNIQFGDGVNRSLNSEIIWRITTIKLATPFAAYTQYVLDAVELSSTDLTTYTIKPWAATASVPHGTGATHGEFQVYKLTAKAITEKPVIKTVSLVPPSTLVDVFVNEAPPIFAAEFNVMVDLPSNPDFNLIGYPNMRGVFTVTAVDVGNKKLTLKSTNTSSNLPTVQNAAGYEYHGSVVYLHNYVSVNITTHEFNLMLKGEVTGAILPANLLDPVSAAAAPITIVAGQWHFILFRGYDYNSTSSQISGWFKVKSVSGLQVTYEYNGSQYDTTLLTGAALARVIVINNATTATDLTRYVPVPVPYKKGITELQLDLARPMFEQRSDAIYTPLMAVSRRFALALNTVLRDKGFGYWGGAIDTKVELYPANGFAFISHKYPINTYRALDTGAYIRPIIPTADYNNPFDKFLFRAVGANYYTIFGNIKNSLGVYEIKTQDAAATTDYTMTYVSAYRGSHLWWSPPTNAKEISNRITTFKYDLQDEINSQDGENIVGAVAYQNYLVVGKRNSLHRTTLSKSGDKIDVERAQSTVGILSGKNMVATESYLYFVHNTGVYYLEGINVVPETTLNRYFDERVYQNAALLPFTAGYHNPVDKEIVLGVPYSPDSTTQMSIVDGQFLYNYNENVAGWSVNKNFPATWWIRMENEDYFSTIDGKVFKKRTERYDSKFRDYEDAIAFRLRTRFINMDSEVNFKFIRNFILQLGMSSVMNVTVNYTWDYFKDTKPLTIIPTTDVKYTSSPYSAVTMVSNKYLKPVRGMVQPNRVAQLGLEIMNAELDKKLEIYGIFIEGQSTNTRLITQKNQQR